MSPDVNYGISWSDGQVLALLDCYDARKEELQHPTKQKFFYENVLQDLLSLNVFERPIQAIQLKNKMSVLLQAYKSASDTEGRTGRGSTKFKFMGQMDEIFGTRPIISNSHTLNLYGDNIVALPVCFKRPILEDVRHDNGVLILDNQGDFDDFCYEGMIYVFTQYVL